VELRTALNAAFDMELPATVTFDYPSIAALANYITPELQEAAEAGAAAAAAAAAASAAAAAAQAALATRASSAGPGRQLALARSAGPAAAQSTTVLVGASGRYPGAAEFGDLSSFWQCMDSCTDLPRLMPLQRWDVEQYFAVQGSGKEGSMYVRLGGFIDNVDAFDPSLFR
jgi:hypothetical protein